MLFSSPIFLFLFLPVVLLTYFLTPKKLKNYTLLLFSLVFYTWGEKELVLLILLSAIVDYTSGILISYGKRRLGLIFSIGFNISILLYFKYANFISENLIQVLEYLNLSSESALELSNIALPIGISFYTFQTMSYTIDVYRGHVKASKNFIDFATYVTLFPQLIAGPIVRYANIEKELKDRKVTVTLFYEGVQRFIIGLSKKMIIANNCALLADGVFNLPASESSAVIAWLGIMAYSFQIYFDFSGYSDMAIGLGKMFGFNFPENFNYPYISKSMREFWRRWHITLSTWFRDYLYISIGGNRKGKWRTYINLIIVFFITGLWHGASWTFVFWGLFHGAFLILERVLELKGLKISSLISHIYVILIINISWVFFRSDTMIDAFNYITTMFNFTLTTNFDFLSFYLTYEVVFALIVAAILSTPIYKNIATYIQNLNITSINYKVLSSIKLIGLFILFFICFIYIATDSYNPFIYFRF
ncbi:MBOAT family protein [Bizionia argentinensis JUB59]|uniref:MBOAT family protein n=1 Tax=Bizionia argentinensis JUB59 TaxID=1046627 RepID=G2EH21_9FLAO|nr:MBOAT family O-acyltransferase [Bizionia argentinensis]EGV42133.1 MBOAT family protein [Bizionia argentinensis JUB59]